MVREELNDVPVGSEETGYQFVTGVLAGSAEHRRVEGSPRKRGERTISVSSSDDFFKAAVFYGAAKET